MPLYDVMPVVRGSVAENRFDQENQLNQENLSYLDNLLDSEDAPDLEKLLDLEISDLYVDDDY